MVKRFVYAVGNSIRDGLKFLVRGMLDIVNFVGKPFGVQLPRFSEPPSDTIVLPLEEEKEKTN